MSAVSDRVLRRERLDELSDCFVECSGYRSYLLRGSDRSLSVDAGVGVAPLGAAVRESSPAPVELLVTHAHWDHVGAAPEFDRVYLHPAERAPDGSLGPESMAPSLRTRPQTFIGEWLERGEPVPPEFDAADYGVPRVPNPEPIEPGARLDLGDRTVEVLAAPGHAAGQVAALDGDAECIYVGDVLGFEGAVIAVFPDSDLDAYWETLNRLSGLIADGTVTSARTGHADPLTGDSLAVFEGAAATVEDVLADRLVGGRVETPWGPAREYRDGDVRVLTPVGEREERTER